MDSINIEYKDEITGDYVALYSEKLDIMSYIDLCRVPRYFAKCKCTTLDMLLFVLCSYIFFYVLRFIELALYLSS